MQIKAAMIQKITAAAPGQAAAQPAAAPALAAKTVDWRVECGHHGSKATRALLERGKRIDVVPDKGKTVEKVTISYRNDATPPPAALKVNGRDVAAGAAQGKYKPYVIDAEFKGDLQNKRFWLTRFWKDYRDVTVYRVEDGTLPVEVHVHSPRQYRLQLKFPAMRSYKGGEKHSRAVQIGGGTLQVKPTEVKFEAKETGWGPSSLKLRTENKSMDGSTSKSDEPKAWGPPIVFEVDGFEAKLDFVEAIGSFLNFAKSLDDIVKSIRENTPQLGWYLEYDLQLLQGVLAAEWYWKEHSDHRVYEYVDLYAKMTLVKLNLEAGIGLAGVGCKAQVYIEIGGKLDLNVSARTVSPDASRVLHVPAQADFFGTVGVRFEAGNYVQVEASGSTGLEYKAVVRWNRGQGESGLRLDYTWTWTGIEVTATASVGAFGIGGQKVWRKRLAEKQKLDEGYWPSDDKFVPPTVSRDRIRQVMLERLTTGWNVQIATTVRPGLFHRNDYMSLETVADKLAEAIDADDKFDRTPDAVKGLAAGVRSDLEAIAVDNDRSYVLESEFKAYLTGELQKRLEKMVSPATALAKSLQA